MALTKVQSQMLGAGTVLQVASYSDTTNYTASRTVQVQIYSGGSFTKLSATSKLVINALVSVRIGQGVNEGWWTNAYFKFTQGGSNFSTTSFTITTEGQSAYMNRPFVINCALTGMPAGAYTLAGFAQSDGSDLYTRGFNLQVIEVEA